MGNFRIVINAVGGHGQDRDKKEGEIVNFYQGGSSTPDALAKTMVEMLKAHGSSVDNAEIIHWPGEESEVIDDLLAGERKGNF